MIHHLLPLLLASLCAASRSHETDRRLDMELLAGYEPRTQITDIAALDLDQQSLNERAFLGDFARARKVYVEGGHSGNYALLTLIDPAPDKSYPAGTTVLGFSDSAGDVIASLFEDVAWGNVSGGNVTIKVLYTTSDEQSHHVDCMVGGLYSFGEAYRAGCLANTGTIQIVPVAQPDAIDTYDYSYDIRKDNYNYRTLQKLSTDAAETMKSKTGDYYDDFKRFVAYYGDTDYGDKWVLAAANASDTLYTSGRGDADFALLAGNKGGQGRAEAMLHGAFLFNVWMQVVRQMEVAIEYCQVPCTAETNGQCRQNAIHEWDAAVAYYAGSLEGQTGAGDGVFPYAVAEHRAREFKTAGYTSNEVEGISYVNLEVMYLFSQAQGLLVGKNVTDVCGSVGHVKNQIVNLMKVPLVQTVLRYAWMREYETEDEKHQAKGASYMAALLPYIYECKRDHAKSLYNYMRIGSDDASIDYSKVKKALEDVYECIGVTCAHVGGWFTDGDYAEGADPCYDASFIVNRNPDKDVESAQSSSSRPGNGSNLGIALGVVVACLAGLAIAGLVLVRQNAKREPEENKNIAAVTAVTEVDLA